MDLTVSDVREVRFGTTRMRAGYDMGEVDAFLDLVEASISAYSASTQALKDEAGALRSQVQQLQSRLEGVTQELHEAQQSASAAALAPAEHDTVIVDESSGAVVVTSSTTDVKIVGDDVESTAENPVVSSPSGDEAFTELRKIRDDMRAMLRSQLEQVEGLSLPGD